MISNLLHIIGLYLDIDEFYKIKDEIKLSVVYYCKNVKDIIKCSSYLTNYMSDTKHTEMDWASLSGYLEVVKYLHYIKKDCTTQAMDFASARGNLKLVQYLHSIGKNCTTNAMDDASKNNHYDVVKYLHYIGKDCTTEAMFTASCYGEIFTFYR